MSTEQKSLFQMEITLTARINAISQRQCDCDGADLGFVYNQNRRNYETTRILRRYESINADDITADPSVCDIT